MFNVGGGELLVILLIALIVLGPQRLPEAARTVGKVVGEIRRMSTGFQREIRDAFEAENDAAAPKRTEPAPLASAVAEVDAGDDVDADDHGDDGVDADGVDGRPVTAVPTGARTDGAGTDGAGIDGAGSNGAGDGPLAPEVGDALDQVVAPVADPSPVTAEPPADDHPADVRASDLGEASHGGPGDTRAAS
jgi:Tat protein translocase TatB subunit